MDVREKKIYKVTLVGLAVNALLIVLKFVSDIVGRSSAMVADAVHSLSDFITDAIVLIFVKIARKFEAHDKVSEAEHHLRKEFGKDTIISIHMEPISNRVC